MYRLSVTLLCVFCFSSALPIPPESRLHSVDKWEQMKASGMVDLANPPCPCTDQSLCNHITKNYRRELYGFMAGKNISNIDWTYITTVVGLQPEYLCVAHQNGARVVAFAPWPYPFTRNETVVDKYVSTVVEQLQYNHFDGVTFDYEYGMSPIDPGRDLYTHAVNKTTTAVHAAINGSSTSVCVTYVPGANNRHYDYRGLSNASDYFYIMDYNTQYNLYDRCLADANAPYAAMNHGISQYKELGIDTQKLIAGLPWYGNAWSCVDMESDTSRFCPLAPGGYQDAPCSQGRAKFLSFLQILDYVTAGMNITEIQFENSTWTNIFNVKDKETGAIQQMWFDDGNTLKMKYQTAFAHGVKGVGPFAFRWFQDANFSHPVAEAEMWMAFDQFFAGNKD